MRTRLSNANVFQKLTGRLLDFLQQGITPEKMALALATGVTVGIVPMLGVTTFLCTIIAIQFRLNMAFLQLVNYVVYPLQLILYIPFLKIGVMVFSKENFNYSLQEITDMLEKDFIATVGKIFVSNLYALLLWLFVAPVVFFFFYFLSRLLFRHFAKKISSEEKL